MLSTFGCDTNCATLLAAAGLVAAPVKVALLVTLRYAASTVAFDGPDGAESLILYTFWGAENFVSFAVKNKVSLVCCSCSNGGELIQRYASFAVGADRCFFSCFTCSPHMRYDVGQEENSRSLQRGSDRCRHITFGADLAAAAAAPARCATRSSIATYAPAITTSFNRSPRWSSVPRAARRLGLARCQKAQESRHGPPLLRVS